MALDKRFGEPFSGSLTFRYKKKKKRSGISPDLF
jgi:hypothetical protein